MSKLTIKNDLTTFTIQHRAICKSNRNHWKGDWFDNLDDANDQADEHLDEFPDHKVQIETKQTSLVRTLYKKSNN